MHVHTLAAEIAMRHHGIISRRLLREAGVPGNTIDRWMQEGSVDVIVPGVYRLFDGDDELQRVTVAVLALRHSAADLETAAWLHGLRVEHSGLPRLVVPHGRTNRSGLAYVRQTQHLPEVDLCEARGVRSLTLARTVCELTPLLSNPAAERLVTRALSGAGLSESELIACDMSMARRGRPGVRLRRERLAPLLTGAAVELSVLEREFFRRYASSGLPSVAPQYRPPWSDGVTGVVDFALVEHRLIVELDGRAWHDSVDARTEDARRDRRAERHGWRVLRFGWDEVVHRWGEVADYLSFVVRGVEPLDTA